MRHWVTDQIGCNARARCYDVGYALFMYYKVTHCNEKVKKTILALFNKCMEYKSKETSERTECLIDAHPAVLFPAMSLLLLFEKFG